MRPQDLPAALRQLEADFRLRQRAVLDGPQGTDVIIDGQPYISFASNDYLGLADHPALVRAMQQGAERWGAGSGASHLVTGHSRAHHEAELALAAFVGAPAALLFGSGYAANLAVITSLVGRGDVVFADRLVHASINDACLLSRADFCRFQHNDLTHLEHLLESTPARTRLIVVDAVYSMDGDEAPLRPLLALAEKYEAWLYVDDAHGFGVLGQGRGAVVEQDLKSSQLIYMATLGKAAGVAGAFVAASQPVIDWLVNKGRTYIFSTAQPPALAETVLASLKLIAAADDRRARLAELIGQFRERMLETKYSIGSSRMPIQPIIIGADEAALSLAARLKTHGFWVPAIRPPTVPENSARLRLSLSATHELSQLSALLDCLLEKSH